jgi:1-phosphofructokinase
MLYTITLNPTIDRTVMLEGNLTLGDVNRGVLCRVCAGGKGINCAEAASGMGVSVAAYTVIGKDNIEEFEKSTRGLSAEIRAEMKKGSTRTCVKITGKNGLVTEVNEKGSGLSADEMRALVARIISDMQNEGKPDMILVSGSVPPGVESGAYAAMIALFRRLGIDTMLDCDGEGLVKGLEASPYLVKPNLSEFEALCGRHFNTLSEIAEAARETALRYNTRMLVTVGADGMLYADADKILQVQVPEVAGSTTVGAGDTVLGVLAAALTKGVEIEKALQLASAAACAKVAGRPSEFPTRKDAAQYLSAVTVTDITPAVPMQEDDGNAAFSEATDMMHEETETADMAENAQFPDEEADFDGNSEEMR